MKYTTSMTLDVGQPLASLNSEAVGNAVVLELHEDIITVLTDFGNAVKMSPDEVMGRFKIPEWWYDCKEMDYPLETLEERIRNQIGLLSDALTSVENKED
jgi:hypothetical protein